GSVRRRAAPIQSRTVIGGASTMGRLAGLPLVRTGFRFAVDDLRFEDAATDGSLVVAVTAHVPGLLSLPSSHSVSLASACVPPEPTCFASIFWPFVMTWTMAMP